MKKLIALLFALPFYSFAANNINDYAYAYKIDLNGDHPIYNFKLPSTVYESLSDNNYADIRIFNSDNAAVPYLLERTVSKVQQESNDYTIPFFPMFIATNKNTHATSININTQKDGTVINVTPLSSVAQQNNGFLLDLSQFEIKPTIFTLHWDTEHSDFNKAIVVMGSNDLAKWTKISDDSSLTNLHFSGNRLIKNKIELPSNNWKYLRIGWSEKLNLILKSIQGKTTTQYLDQPRQIVRLSTKSYDSETKSFFYFNKGRFPIDQLSVTLKPKNSLLNISIASSEFKDGPWYTRHNGIAYNLQQSGKIVSSDTISIVPTNNNYWRITVETDRDNIVSFSPELKLGWLAHKLTFIAEGAPPFIIAFGNSNAEINNTEKSITRLVTQQNKAIPKAILYLTSRVTLGGESRLYIKSQKDINTKTIILWSVLILGLIILALMAMQLFKQINTKEE